MGSLGRSHLPGAAPGLVVLGNRGWDPALVGTASAGGWSERGSGRQNDPLHRIGSSREAFCPVVGVMAGNMVPHPRNPGKGGGQEGMEVAER